MNNILPDELFPTDYPLSKKELIGRESDFENLFQRSISGLNTVIATPRRMGKSSLANAVLEEISRDNNFYTVSLDLWGISNLEEFASELFLATIKNQNGGSQLVSKIKNRWHKMNSTEVSSLGTITASEESISFTPTLLENPIELFEFSVKYLQILAKKDSKRIVLFLDEFQNFIEFDDSSQTLQKKLRTLLQNSRNVTTIFAGSIGTLMEETFSDSKAPLSSFGGTLSLSSIDSEDWNKGIQSRLEKADMTITSDAFSSLMNKTEGHPYATMLILQHSYLIASFKNQLLIDLNIIEKGFNAAISADRDKHRLIIERVRAFGGKVGPESVKTLKKISKKEAIFENVKPNSPEKKNIQRSLDKLELTGFIINDNKEWKIINPLLDYYCKIELP